MSLRDSLELIRAVRPDAGASALEHEILGERAASLGAAEQRVIHALAAMTSSVGDQTDRLAAAQKAVWEYFVQRELVGFRRHTDVIQDLNIPHQVLAGLGASPGRGK